MLLSAFQPYPFQMRRSIEERCFNVLVLAFDSKAIPKGLCIVIYEDLS